MTHTQKQQIASAIAQMAEKTSQKRLATKAGVSAATINHLIHGKWELIKDDLWRRVQVSLRIDPSWNHADTRNYTMITELCQAAQNRSLSIAISFKEGHSKSHSFKAFERNHENVIYVECKNYWTKKNYVQELLRACGIDADGTVGQMIEDFVAHIQSLHKPLLIIDQADKLKDPQLDLFMDLYNDLEGHCGFVLSGVPALEKRIIRGVRRDKIGYREIYSRLGRRFIKLEKTSLTDVQAVCFANGLTDEDHIVQIFNESEGDMRRVRREIEKYYLTQKAA